MFTLKFSLDSNIMDHIIANGNCTPIASFSYGGVRPRETLLLMEDGSALYLLSESCRGYIEIRRGKRYIKVIIVSKQMPCVDMILHEHGYAFTNFPSELFGIRKIGQQGYWPVARPVKDLNYGLMCNGAEESFLVTDALIQNVKEMMRSIVVHGSRRVL
jgi:hypothetical protein